MKLATKSCVKTTGLGDAVVPDVCTTKHGSFLASTNILHMGNDGSCSQGGLPGLDCPRHVTRLIPEFPEPPEIV